MVPIEEIADAKNDYNLNLPRYIDSTEPEDLQDMDGHLRGGIPERDVDALDKYWKIMPTLRAALFEKFNRAGYCQLRLPIAEAKPAIFGHAEFTAFHEFATRLFTNWKRASTPLFKGFARDSHPKRPHLSRAANRSVWEGARSMPFRSGASKDADYRMTKR